MGLCKDVALLLLPPEAGMGLVDKKKRKVCETPIPFFFLHQERGREEGREDHSANMKRGHEYLPLREDKR